MSRQAPPFYDPAYDAAIEGRRLKKLQPWEWALEFPREPGDAEQHDRLRRELDDYGEAITGRGADAPPDDWGR